MLLLAVALLLPLACGGLSGFELCQTINLGIPTTAWAADPFPGFGRVYENIGWTRGPVLDIHCCHEVNAQCPGVDCTQPLFTAGQAFTIPAATVQYEDGVALCGVWVYQERVQGVWWEDDL